MAKSASSLMTLASFVSGRLEYGTDESDDRVVPGSTGSIALPADSVSRRVGSLPHAGGHADIADSSIMLALHLEPVRREEAGAGYLGRVAPDAMERMGWDEIGAIAPTGVLGDPSGMSEAIGRRCIEELVELRAAHARESAPV